MRDVSLDSFVRTSSLRKRKDDEKECTVQVRRSLPTAAGERRVGAAGRRPARKQYLDGSRLLTHTHTPF